MFDSVNVSTAGSHRSGFHAGTGCRRMWSTPPKVTASTTKNGNTKNTSRKTVAGMANDGQNHRGYQARSPEVAVQTPAVSSAYAACHRASAVAGNSSSLEPWSMSLSTM